MADRPPTSRPLDRAFDALRAPDRRRLLHLLVTTADGTGESVSLRDATPPGNDPAAYRTRMLHTHVPKLVEYGYVEDGEDEDVVRPGEQFDEIARLIGVFLEHRDRLPGEFP